jgi:hypothetical protein
MSTQEEILQSCKQLAAELEEEASMLMKEFTDIPNLTKDHMLLALEYCGLGYPCGFGMPQLREELNTIISSENKTN